MIRKASFVVGIVLIAAGLLWATSSSDQPPKKTTASKLLGSEKTIAWSNLPRVLRSGQTEKVLLQPSGLADITFRDDSVASAGFPTGEINRVASWAKEGGARVDIAPAARASGKTSWLSILLLALVVGGVISAAFYFFWQRREMSSEKESERSSEESTARFADVAGCQEAVEEVQEFVLFLQDSKMFQKLGARMPSGAILHGPPGTGKTLLARALAGEAGVPFYSFAGSEAVNKYVGVGASSVRSLFQRARKSPRGAVIFIDEIDAIGKRRSGSEEASSREHDNTLNQLLVELDGFSGRENIVVIGATNRVDTLDPALLRPGRLSRQIPVLHPDEAGRLEILQMYAKGKPLAADVDLSSLARITSGSTGADLADMMNEAAIQAARSGSSEISDSDLREGHLRALAGPARKSQKLQEGERRQVAFHEAGHVLCAELCPEHEKAERVTIVARGHAAGLAVWGQEDRALHSPEYVHQRLIAALGGRAAERVEFGSVSSGAASDLQSANELARTAIEDWGISQRTGQLLSRSGHAISDRTRSLVDQEVEEMVALAFRDAVDLLENHREALQRLAEALLREEVLERIDILAVLGRLPQKSKPSASRPQPSLLPVLNAKGHKEPRRPIKSFLLFLRSRKREPSSS